MNNIKNNVFRHKNGAAGYTNIKKMTDIEATSPMILYIGDNKYTANDISKMIQCLVDNTYARFGEQLFWQTVGIPMGKNCVKLMGDLFLYCYGNELFRYHH